MNLKTSVEFKSVYMKNLRHPNFILAIISALVLFVGILLRKNSFVEGDIVVIVGLALAGIHWLWAIIDVINRRDMKAYQKRFWLIIVVAVPVFGAMVFYGLHQEKDKIVT